MIIKQAGNISQTMSSIAEMACLASFAIIETDIFLRNMMETEIETARLT